MNYENNNIPGDNTGMNGVNPAPDGINQMNQMNQMNQPNQMDPMNSMNPMDNSMSTLNSPGIVPGPAPKKKNMLPIIIAVVAVVAVLGGVFAFKTITSSPKTVFKNAIKNMYKGVNTTIKEVETFTEKLDIKNKAILVSADTSIDTNIEGVEIEGAELKDLRVGGSVGVDVNKKQLSVGAFVKGPKEEITGDMYYLNDTMYIASNLLEEMVYDKDQSSIDIPFDEIEEALEAINDNRLEFSEVDYLAEAITNALAESLESDSMDKETEKVELDDKEKSYTKYSYKLTDKALKSLLKNTLEKLKKDDKFLEILEKVAEMEDVEFDAEESLDTLIEETDDIEYETKIVLNIYTKGFVAKFAGMSLEIDNTEMIRYVDDGKNFKLTVAGEPDGDDALVVEGTKEGEKVTAKVTAEGEEIAEITINSLTDEKIDIECTLNVSGESITIGIYLTQKEDKSSISGEYKFSVEADGQYLKTDGSYAIESKDSLDIPDTKKAVNYDQIDGNKVMKNIEEIMENDDTISAIAETIIDNLESTYEPKNPYDDPYDYGDDDDEVTIAPSSTDMNDMKVLNGETAIKEALAKTGIIYVGDVSYFESEVNETALLDNLIAVADELDITVNRVSGFEYEYTDTIKALFSGITPVCKNVTPTCEETPIIFFVKDGSIVSALSGAPTVAEIKAEYQKIA